MRLLLIAVALATLGSPAYAQLAVPTDAGLTYGHVHLNVTDMELNKQLWVEHFGGVVVEKGSLTAIRLPNFLIALTEREPTAPSRGTAPPSASRRCCTRTAGATGSATATACS